MRIMGMTLGTTRDGLDLMDGNAAYFVAGQPRRMIAEERLSRVKHDGGIRQAIHYCLGNESLEDVDLFVVTNCCDGIPDHDLVDEVLRHERIDIPRDKVVACPSHHLAHAAAAFYSSPFDEALVVVADNEGNVIGGREQPFYIDNALEKTSVYRANRSGIELVDRYHDHPGALGIGNAYAHFTEYIGFESYQAAGKVMGLAAYGDAAAVGDRPLFEHGRDGRLTCALEPLANKRLAVRRFLTSATGRPHGYFAAGSTEHPAPAQADIAAYVQRETELALMSVVEHAIERTGVRDVCLAGGVALNCIANGRILRETRTSRLHVGASPGDSGQGLGAVLWYLNRGGARRAPPIAAYQGRPYTCQEIRAAIARHADEVDDVEVADPAAAAAQDLADHKIVFWHQGASEYGPRALGNRSILANPDRAEVKDTLNHRVKRREAFRPFAPAVLQSAAESLFGLSNSPFMHIAAPASSRAARIAPGIVHVDGTARVQTVAPDSNPRLHALISEFAARTDIPMVLNTSMNLRGEPICESPGDALRCFLETDGDVLYLDTYRVTRR